MNNWKLIQISNSEFIFPPCKYFLDKRPSGPALLKKQEYWECQFYKTRSRAQQAKMKVTAGQQLGGSLPLTPSNLNNSLEQTRDKPKRKRTWQNRFAQEQITLQKTTRFQDHGSGAWSSSFQLRSSEFNEDSWCLSLHITEPIQRCAFSLCSTLHFCMKEIIRRTPTSGVDATMLLKIRSFSSEPKSPG
jgi:hypothetical protein